HEAAQRAAAAGADDQIGGGEPESDAALDVIALAEDLLGGHARTKLCGRGNGDERERSESPGDRRQRRSRMGFGHGSWLWTVFRDYWTVFRDCPVVCKRL